MYAPSTSGRFDHSGQSQLQDITHITKNIIGRCHELENEISIEKKRQMLHKKECDRFEALVEVESEQISEEKILQNQIDVLQKEMRNLVQIATGGQ